MTNSCRYVSLVLFGLTSLLLVGCPTAPTASFSASPREGTAPFTVQFVDVSDPGSNPITSWQWSFGDGGSSTAANPTYVYDSSGSYSVSLTVSTADGMDSMVIYDYIRVHELPEARFTSAASVHNSLEITFADTSSPGSAPITQWAWDFGDGGTATTQDAVNTYANAGSYIVTLEVTTSYGSATHSQTVEIEDPAVPPTASFTYSSTGGESLQIAFTDTSNAGSAPITGWHWDFGDSASSDQSSPAHTYGAGGSYDITLTVTSADGSDSVTQTVVIVVDDEEGSAASLSLRGFDPATFFSNTAGVIIDIAGMTFDARPEYTSILVNGELLEESELQVAASSVVILRELQEGENQIELYSQDADGKLLTGNWTPWIGDRELNVTVLDSAGALVSGATVKATLSDDVNISATATTGDNGVAVFANLPDRTLLLEAQSPINEVGALAVTGDAGYVTVSLKEFNEPSLIDNNDLSQGTEGWQVNDAPVTVVPGDEESNSSATKANEDQNLLLTTSGEGPVTISRTFFAKPGTKRVGIRYAFITSEVPGGYYGSKYNDGYSVSIRTSSGGQVVSDSRSMNSFPVSEFDGNGRTAYRELSTPLNVAGDAIQVDLTVTNVGDALYDSSVLVDLIFERSFDIVAMSLRDIDNNGLRYLSSSTHSYFDGNTRVHGTVRISGSEGDGVASLKLNVLHGGQPVASATLNSALTATLVRAFDATGIVEITTPQLLFLLPASEAALVEATGAESVTLQVEANSTGGETAQKNYTLPVEVLLHYKAANRYSEDRDEVEGGDDWVRRSVRDFLGSYTSDITINDFSNMNGGPFDDHSSHQRGVDIDGKYTGYSLRDAAAATTMINLLNRSLDKRIIMVFVTYEQTDTNAFWNAIRNVTLQDGRKASTVIRPLEKHTSHFHWRISDQP